MNGNTDKAMTTKLPPKLPTNEKVWIKYSLLDNTIDGISQGKPVKINALRYSTNDNKITIIIIEQSCFLVKSLARKNATPQKIANKLGSKITATGMK